MSSLNPLNPLNPASSYQPTSIIYVYLFSETYKYLQSNGNKIIPTIEKDTSTTIMFISYKTESYYKISGSYENVHRARIILNEFEKNLYRESYLNRI
jgi:hypothetical protein